MSLTMENGKSHENIIGKNIKHLKLEQDNRNLLEENRNLSDTNCLIKTQLKEELEKQFSLSQKYQSEIENLKKKIGLLTDERSRLKKNIDNLILSSCQGKEKYNKLSERNNELEKIIENTCSSTVEDGTLLQKNIDELKKENSKLQMLINSNTEQHSKKMGVLTNDKSLLIEKVFRLYESLREEKTKTCVLITEKDNLQHKMYSLLHEYKRAYACKTCQIFRQQIGESTDAASKTSNTIAKENLSYIELSPTVPPSNSPLINVLSSPNSVSTSKLDIPKLLNMGVRNNPELNVSPRMNIALEIEKSMIEQKNEDTHEKTSPISSTWCPQRNILPQNPIDTGFKNNEKEYPLLASMLRKQT